MCLQFNASVRRIEFVSVCVRKFARARSPRQIPCTISQEEFAREKAEIEREHLARVEAHELETEEMQREHLAKIESHEVMNHICTCFRRAPWLNKEDHHF